MTEQLTLAYAWLAWFDGFAWGMTTAAALVFGLKWHSRRSRR